ncbi:hypothetical protein U0070_009979 [Myodes glareolus]|uniref:Developmental pluripotency-associated protein 2/4 central domain-containing protein n=1 Tax=Myodes glareolus TaxID=447135 RepID=A0AAW0HCI2_MYOGA
MRGFTRSEYIKRMQWTGPENVAEMELPGANTPHPWGPRLKGPPLSEAGREQNQSASLPSEQRLKMEQDRTVRVNLMTCSGRFSAFALGHTSNDAPLRIPHGSHIQCIEQLNSTREVECQISRQPSTSFAKTPAMQKRPKKRPKEDDCKSNEKAQDAETPKPTPRKVPVPPLPAHLPPMNPIHRDVWWAWCKKVKLSSKGPPGLENIPDTPKEARVKTCWKKMKTETEEEQEPCPQEQVPALTEPLVLCEEDGRAVVTTAAFEAVLASWARIAANAKKNEALQSITTPKTYALLPQGNRSVWSTGEAFLQTQVVGFSCSSTLDKPGYLRSRGKHNIAVLE